MYYMLVRHEVKDFNTWKKVLDSQAKVHQDTQMELMHVWRDTQNPKMVVFLLRLHDIEKAKAFLNTPDVNNVAGKAGVLGEPEIFFLTD